MISLDDLLKVGSRMLADRTDEIFGKLLSHIFIPAYLTSPYSLAVRSLTDSLGLGLDIALVI